MISRGGGGQIVSKTEEEEGHCDKTEDHRLYRVYVCVCEGGCKRRNVGLGASVISTGQLPQFPMCLHVYVKVFLKNSTHVCMYTCIYIVQMCISMIAHAHRQCMDVSLSSLQVKSYLWQRLECDY